MPDNVTDGFVAVEFVTVGHVGLFADPPPMLQSTTDPLALVSMNGKLRPIWKLWN
jgi:hypothetical protein